MVKAAVVHKAAINMIQVSQSTGYIVTASADKTAKCFDLRGGEGKNLSRVKTLENSDSITCGKILDHGNLCMLGSVDGNITAYDLSSGGKDGNSLYSYGTDAVGAVNCMAVCPYYRSLVVCLLYTSPSPRDA